MRDYKAGRQVAQPATERRPNLLFLAHRFPPFNTSACVRTWNTAKYLTRLGWNVTVVTPHPALARHLEDPLEFDACLEREGIQRILTGHNWRCLDPDVFRCSSDAVGRFTEGLCRKVARRLHVDKGFGWMRQAERACSHLTRSDVDIVLATGKPFSIFKAARRLSQRLGRPYVLDYRDLWSGNPHALESPRPATVREEASLLRDSAAVTIVSPSCGMAMDRRFCLGPKLNIVTNGFDPENLASIKPHDFGHFAIVHAGSFRPPKRVITPIMSALKRVEESLNGKTCKWYFHHYGGQEEHVRLAADRFGLRERVVLHGMVSRHEALSALKGAALSIVITSVADGASLEDKGIVTGKVFESIGLQTPVLAVAPSGSDVEAILQSTGSGESFSANNVQGLAQFIANAISGRPFAIRNVEEWAWPAIARRLDQVLRSALSNC